MWTKSCEVTNQIKTLCLYLHMVLLVFQISQNEIWKFGRNLLLAKFGSKRVKPVAVDRHVMPYSSSFRSKIELIAPSLPLSITSIVHSC